MRLRYLKQDGEERDVELSEKPITIGRSGDADVLVLDEKASRVHCGIRFSDGAFYIKDLKSKNGTFVNDKQVDLHQLRPGDQILIGSTAFQFEQEGMGSQTALNEMQGKMDDGKGFSTILREIVHEAGDEKPVAKQSATPEKNDEPEEEPDAAPAVEPEDADEPDAPKPVTKRVVASKPKAKGSRKAVVKKTGGGKKFVVKKKAVKVKKRKPPPEPD